MDAVTARAAARDTAAVANAPNTSERVLGWLALLMLAVASLAIARGHGGWARVPWTIWAHLATVMLPLALTPAILWYPRGSRRHRVLGYVWVASLAITAIISLDIRQVNAGHFSFIHLISLYVLVLLPLLVLSARAHQVARHRRIVRGLVIGGLLVAGFFTLPFGRMLGVWLVAG